jgi:hypothetical protein
MDVIIIDGSPFKVVHTFTASRVLIDYDTLFVLADRAKDGTWDLSGQPTTVEEEQVLKALLDPTNDQTSVKVIPPEG